LRLLRFLHLPRCRRGGAQELVRGALHAAEGDALPRPALLLPCLCLALRRGGGEHRARALGAHQPRQPQGKHPADAPARRPDPVEGPRPCDQGSGVEEALKMAIRAELAPRNARGRLIVALDLAATEDAERLVAALGEAVSFYKIGMQLVFAGGLP